MAVLSSHMRIPISRSLFGLVLLAIPASSGEKVSFGGFSIDFVDVGHPGNVDDDTGYGRVPYPYRIAAHEISEDMVARASAIGSLRLTQSRRGGNKPSTEITWNEAARFVNWLNTSQGYPPAYRFSAQPGEEDYHTSETITLWSSEEAWQLGGENLFRHKDARYFLPSEDEWYKAAYYDGRTNTYFDYATGSDTAPRTVASGKLANTAVYARQFSKGPADIKNAGGLSPYGTMAQNGNAQEWTESGFEAPSDSAEERRTVRGGGWSYGGVRATYRRRASPSISLSQAGFRVAAVPEGTTLDADRDNLPDAWEEINGLDPKNAADAAEDPDSDSLTNLEEAERGTDPNSDDTDKDGLTDGVETLTGTWTSNEDTGTDPRKDDTDLDGLKDGVETNTKTFVSETDTGTDPNTNDSDGDGAYDGREVGSQTDPTNPAESPILTISFGEFSIDFVDIGDPGNADDLERGIAVRGGVPYEFQIGMHEVSRDMIQKANKAGNLNLTLADMSPTGGNGVDKPATGISWNEAARFVNWLNTSQGFQPAYRVSKQPGDAGYDPNEDVRSWTGQDVWQLGGENQFRHKDARYFLPSEDEWYKAAHYDGVTQTYFEYATGSNTAPRPVIGGTLSRTAVFDHGFHTGPANIKNAGGLSPYGTMAQFGNVWELMESGYHPPNNYAWESRVYRGGLWFSSHLIYRREMDRPSHDSFTIGFRVAALPGGRTDTDGDGMTDVWELFNGLDPQNAADADEDPDSDTLTNLEEFERGIDPRSDDTDDDGLKDSVETGTGTWTSHEDTGTDPKSEDTDGGRPQGRRGNQHHDLRKRFRYRNRSAQGGFRR